MFCPVGFPEKNSESVKPELRPKNTLCSLLQISVGTAMRRLAFSCVVLLYFLPHFPFHEKNVPTATDTQSFDTVSVDANARPAAGPSA